MRLRSIKRNRDSVVGIALDGPEFQSGKRFCLLHNDHTGSEAHPAYYSMDTGVTSQANVASIITRTVHSKLKRICESIYVI
jgi:hypothetical protein